MNSLKPYIDSLLKIWQENSPAARVGLILLAGLCVVAIGGVGYWSVQPSYVLLVSGSDSEKVNNVIDALAKEGIAYELEDVGLMVDKRDFPKARMLARSSGVVTADSSSGGSLGGAFSSPTERRNLARMQREQDLARTIEKTGFVEQAVVHLNVPDRGPFERKKSMPSASVLLTLRPDALLSESQAGSIAKIVAYSVEDLDPTAVHITDKEGNSYSTPDEQTHQINSQVEYAQAAERYLAEKAERQLVNFVGFGNASVQVSADYSFTTGSRTSTKYDKDGKVPNKEAVISESTTNKSDKPEGATGVASNLQSRQVNGANTESKTEDITTEYLVSKTEETEATTTPVRNFMTVSVLVNSEAAGMAAEDGTLLPGMQEKVEGIVKNAVGFRSDTDAISVEFMSFPENPLAVEPAPVPFDWNNLLSIVESASLAIGALFAFLIGVMLLRKFQPTQDRGGSGSGAGLDGERSGSVAQLSALIKDNPEVFTQIVRSWSGADHEESKQGSDPNEVERKVA
ncbi:MAG: flagellar M-ring protein FliF C-terminal domain-containing protein [Pirellulaceae bacterium]